MQRDGGAVVLQFTHNVERFIQCSLHPVIKIGHLPFGVSILQGEHRIAVFHLGEVLVDVTSYTHGGRVGIVPFGMLCLKLCQLLHQHIILPV
ncbi:hypothetical protein SDC9_191116 [bioreactor metagenome]|uniref:Uncharacterized protein n=1 Tax=bioreactor metagenome TaxID=1076179 RepID=A0A645HY82_9ZZZZ